MLTRQLIWTVATLVVLFDIAIVALRGPSASISWTLLDMARNYPIIAFALGVVAGHVFWPLPVPYDPGAQP